ncbi:MAG TPA: redoxin domain-containing protein [Acidimicrobiia bacterium]|nr:redoxin domain-containing protein [Acidimicrobiia bacterium]
MSEHEGDGRPRPASSDAATSSRPSQGRWTSRKKYGVLALALAVFAIAAVIVASGSNPSTVAGNSVNVHNLPVGPTPPSLTAAQGWLNSPPLAPADLRGKVVLYDFWTYSCVNCDREIPHLAAFYDRYAPNGLVVIGIHSPEFQFEQDRTNVTEAVQRLKVPYPVALDPNMDIWNAFGAQYWPEAWVADRAGHLRYMDIGEGNYTQTEDVLRALLGVSAHSPRASAVGAGALGAPPTTHQNITNETYLGLEKGVENVQPGTTTYPDVAPTLPNGAAALVGSWTADQEQVQAAAPGASIVLGYQARSANLVLATATGAPVQVQVQLDGHPLPPADRTSETQVDAQGNTFITVSAPDLYKLVLTPGIERHTLRLTAEQPGLQAFAFTFGA